MAMISTTTDAPKPMGESGVNSMTPNSQTRLIVTIIVIGMLGQGLSFLVLGYSRLLFPAGPGHGIALGKMWMGLSYGALAGLVLSFFLVDRRPLLSLRLFAGVAAAGLTMAGLSQSWDQTY